MWKLVNVALILPFRYYLQFQFLFFLVIRWNSQVSKIFWSGEIQSCNSLDLIVTLLIYGENYYIAIWAAAASVFGSILALRSFILRNFYCGLAFHVENSCCLNDTIEICPRVLNTRNQGCCCSNKSFTLCCIGDDEKWSH